MLRNIQRYFVFSFFFVTTSSLSNEIFVDGKLFTSLEDAVADIKDGSKVFLGAGSYANGAYIGANNVSLLGEPGVVFDGALADGKAALVLAGNDVVVESIECVNISAPAGNGACIRFEGKNLTVRGLYAHDSESGVMTAGDAGRVEIAFSRFERLGNRNGYTHAMYIIASELIVRNTSILRTKRQGSGIKSRSRKVLVENSVLASLDGVDSRLIDMANYGQLIVRNSILQQGNESSNSQLIAYGLEQNVARQAPINTITMTNNLIILDRERANVIVASRLADNKDIRDNIIIGDFNHTDEYTEQNTWYKSREKAKILASPFLPKIHERQTMMETIRIIGEAE